MSAMAGTGTKYSVQATNASLVSMLPEGVSPVRFQLRGPRWGGGCDSELRISFPSEARGAAGPVDWPLCVRSRVRPTRARVR